MIKMKAKTVLLAVAIIGFTSTAVSVQGHQGDVDRPSITNSQPGDMMPNDTIQPNASIPGLPDSASDTAKQVVDTINQAFETGVRNLGNALQSLLGQ